MTDDSDEEFRQATIKKRAALLAKAAKAARQIELWTETQKQAREEAYHLGQYLKLSPDENPSPYMDMLKALAGSSPFANLGIGYTTVGSDSSNSLYSGLLAPNIAAPDSALPPPESPGIARPEADSSGDTQGPPKRGQKMFTALMAIAERGLEGATLDDIIKRGGHDGIMFIRPSLRSQLSKLCNAEDPMIRTQDGRYYWITKKKNTPADDPAEVSK